MRTTSNRATRSGPKYAKGESARILYRQYRRSSSTLSTGYLLKHGAACPAGGRFGIHPGIALAETPDKALIVGRRVDVEQDVVPVHGKRVNQFRVLVNKLPAAKTAVAVQECPPVLTIADNGIAAPPLVLRYEDRTMTALSKRADKFTDVRRLQQCLV